MNPISMVINSISLNLRSFLCLPARKVSCLLQFMNMTHLVFNFISYLLQQFALDPVIQNKKKDHVVLDLGKSVILHENSMSKPSLSDSKC